MEIVVYGMGKNGQEFIQDVEEAAKDVKIIAATDTYIHNPGLQCRETIPCIEPCRIQDYAYDYVVVTPMKYFDEIKRSLLAAGVGEEKIKSLKEMEGMLGTLHCNLCGSGVFAWRYIGEEQDVFCSKNIGAGRRRGGCPICGSLDRTRYVYHIIRNYTSLLDGAGCSVLHFAPESMLSEKIRSACGGGYVTADIAPQKADVAADISDMQFNDGQFDYIICNHVMEHIREEGRAFSELGRCLKRGGILILTVPVCWEQATYEDENVITQKDRIKYYGQRDHVRLYGNDIVGRIEKFGFEVTLFRCSEAEDGEDIDRLGFIKGDSVFLCKKK